MSVINLEKNKWNETVADSVKPVVVDFWAPWCGYCRRLSPAVDRLAEELQDKVQVVKVDIDEHPELAQKYAIDTIPTLALFKGGEEVDQVVNPPSQAAIEGWLQEHQVI